MKTALREILKSLTLSLMVFLLVQNTFLTSIVVGFSMEPELHNGQRLLVNKVTYHFTDPKRGDIIIFRPPVDPNSAPYIKRIIGLPGDRVEVKMGAVYINGSLLDEPYITEEASYSMSEQVVPGGEYFVLGDNRDNTSDSHVWGTLPRKNIIGQACLSIWPPEDWGLALNYRFDELSTPE